MQAKRELAYQRADYFGRTQKRPIALRAPNLHLFTAQEVGLIYSIIQKWRGKNAAEISDHSHLFIGWKVAREKETIPYSTALIGTRKPSDEEEERGLALEGRDIQILRRHAAS